MNINLKIVQGASGRRRTARLALAAAAVGAIALSACRDFDVENLNAPTDDQLTNAPSRAVLARTAIGIQIEAFNDLAGEIQQWGLYGRELYNLLGNDPRETGEELSGPQDPGGRAGGVWVGKYGAIRTIHTYLSVLRSSPDLTAETELRASEGFAKTIKAWHLHKLAIRSGETGLPVETDRPIEAEPAPLVTSAAAREAASDLLDEALGDLQAGGTAFPFTFVPGYTGFTTPATFAQFNRALAAKVLVHRATFDDCTTCWAEAATALAGSFVTDVGLPGSLSLGVYYGYTGVAGELSNPITEPLSSLRYWVHPSIVTGVQLQPGGQPDLRLTRKAIRLTPALVTGDTIRTLNGLVGTYKPILYNNANFSANTGADIPWITNEELLLLRAEIRWNTGNKAGAVSDINLIRQHAGGLGPSTLTALSSDDAFITELLYNRLMSLMFSQGVRWIDARRYDRIDTLPLDRDDDVIHPHMLIPATECDARGLTPPCSI